MFTVSLTQLGSSLYKCGPSSRTATVCVTLGDLYLRVRALALQAISRADLDFSL